MWNRPRREGDLALELEAPDASDDDDDASASRSAFGLKLAALAAEFEQSLGLADSGKQAATKKSAVAAAAAAAHAQAAPYTWLESAVVGSSTNQASFTAHDTASEVARAGKKAASSASSAAAASAIVPLKIHRASAATKVCQARIYSMCMHPSASDSSLLVAAGA